MNIDYHIPAPGAKRPIKYARYLCLDGELEGRGLIADERWTGALGYVFKRLSDGTLVAKKNIETGC